MGHPPHLARRIDDTEVTMTMSEQPNHAVHLGRAGVDFVKFQVAHGDNLAHLLSEELPIGEGDVIVYLPPGVDLTQLDFLEGGLSRYEVTRDIDRPVQDLILQFLARNPENAIVFEAGVQRLDRAIVPMEGFRCLTLSPSRHRIYTDHPSRGGYEVPGRAVYTFIRGRPTSQDLIQQGFARARQYPSIAVLTSLPAEFAPNGVQEVGIDCLRRVARLTEHIIIGAYDEAAHLFWSKRNTGSRGNA
jgi:hypothetical protein